MKPDTFDKYVNKVASGCWEWTGCLISAGYGRYRGKAAHRVAFERANGPIPDGLFVCHSCDNRPCVNPAHLWLGTHLDNMRDMIAKGRGGYGPWNGQRRGERNPFAKLTPEVVAEIKRLRGKVSQQKLADRFGVCQATVSHVQIGRAWPHAH